jgi:hypothetical protein
MSVRLVQHLVSFLNNVEDLTDLERKLAFRAIGIVANGTLTMDEERRLKRIPIILKHSLHA